MTSVTSLVKRHPAINLFRKTLKKQVPISVLVTIFGLLLSVGAPLREWLWVTGMLEEETISLEYSFQYSALAGFCTAVGLTFILLLFNFNFLFSKKAGDVFQALPLTRSGLLLSRSLPALIGGVFTLSVSFGGFGIMNILPSVESIEFSTIVLSYLLALLFLVCLWSAMLIVVVCSGGVLDVIIAFAAFNVAPCVLIWILIASVESTTIGLHISETVLIYTTPFVFTFFKLSCFTDPNYGDPQFMVDNAELTTVWTILGTVALTLVLLGVTVKLFSLRKSETAGSAYSFKLVPTLLTILVSMVGGYLCGLLFTGDADLLNVSFWIFFCIGAMLCSVAIGMIISRGFKKIKRSLVNGVITIALLIVVTLTTNLIVLNEEKQVPKVEKVESISISYRDITYTDPDDIKDIVAIHENIVSNLRNDTYADDTPAIFTNFHGFEITYTLKNGRQIKRNYGLYLINDEELHHKVFGLMQKDEFLSQYDFILDQPHTVSFDIVLQNEMGIDDSYISTLTPKEAEVFLQIFRNELMAANDTVFDDECHNVVIRGEDFYEDIWIPASFSKTMEYLEGHKTDDETLAKK